MFFVAPSQLHIPDMVCPHDFFRLLVALKNANRINLGNRRSKTFSDYHCL